MVCNMCICDILLVCNILCVQVFIYTLTYIHNTYVCVGKVAQGYKREPILDLTEVRISVVYDAGFCCLLVFFFFPE